MQLPKRRIFLLVGVGIALCVIWSIVFGPSSADMRLDTGDIRYRYFGVPLIYERMPEPQRSRLLSLASTSSILVAEWHQCANYPLPTTNNTDAMCRGFYTKVDAWIDVDPHIARLAAEDLATYIRVTNARESLPESYALLSGFVVDWTNANRYAVRGDWRDDEAVRAYFEAHGVAIPPHNQRLKLTGDAREGE